MKSVEVAIIGGGIGGLTLARALRGSGVEARIYERVSQFGPVGAGIQIAPNASKLLYRLGLQERLEKVGVLPAAQIFSRWDDDGTLVTTSLRDVASAFGAPHVTIHRADLHQVLLDGIADVVETGAEIVKLEHHDSAPRLTFADGRQVEARIVVGADGIHSAVRNTIVEDEPRYSGQSVFRGLLSADRAPNPRYADNVNLWLGPDQHCGCYPISAGKIISFAATLPLERSGRESWNEPGDVADLLKAYAGWTPDLRGLFAAADAVSVWALYDRAPLEQIHAGRLALVGDAAHPMLPFLSQGANQSIEDAVVLATCLRRLGATEDALVAYDAVRRARSNEIQATSLKNNTRFHLPDGEDQRARDAAFRSAGLSGLDRSKQDWLYGYDAEEDAVHHLEFERRG
jgi:salicylate hydroxylase